MKLKKAVAWVIIMAFATFILAAISVGLYHTCLPLWQRGGWDRAFIFLWPIGLTTTVGLVLWAIVKVFDE